MSDEKTIDSDAKGQGQPVAGTWANPEASAEETRVQIGPEDLVICADDGKFYVVYKATYIAEPLPSSMEALPKQLLRLGSVIATINPGVFPGVGSACYIINLPLMRKPTLP
jgi:hypothetical protein